MMRLSRLALLGAVLAAASSHPVLAQWTAQQWIEKLEMKAAGRLAAVNNLYVERLKPKGIAGAAGGVPGLYASGTNQRGQCVSNCRVYEVVEVPWTLRGEPTVTSHLLSPMEVAVRAGLTPDSMVLDAMGTGYAIAQDLIDQNAQDAMGPAAGLASLVFGDLDILETEEVIDDAEDRTWEQDPRESPWLNPFRLFGAGAGMMFETADAVAEAEISHLRSAEEAREERAQQHAFLQGVETVGVEQVGDRSAMHLGVRIPESARTPMVVDGQEFTYTSAGLWIDTEEYVLLKHRVEGQAKAGRQSREFFIETVQSDFRHPAGCGEMYEPYRRVMRMGGMLDESQMAEMEEARRQLEEFDRQVAAMPAEQREMVESMMAGQMEQARGLLNGGALEHVEEVEEILCDPDLKALFSVDGGASAAALMEGYDLREMQRHLSALGYEPGNTDGVLDTMTRVAISQFQAEHGMPVTAEPSRQVAEALAAEMERQGLA